VRRLRRAAQLSLFGHLVVPVPDAPELRPKRRVPLADRPAHTPSDRLRVLLNAVHSAVGRYQESSGHAILDEAAAEAVRGWTFQPAQEGDVAVESILHVPIRFQLRR